MLNLDTHIFLFALDGHVNTTERRLLEENPWGISAIVLWELAKLCQLKRIDVDLKSADFTRRLSRIHIWPLDLAVCRTILGLDFSSDPADEIIAATSIVHHVPLVTRDRRILSSKLVPFPKRTAN
ncbi:MAG TPA: PIN domain-containing protein [Terriglobales bacterium]|nr:PIN domain-containing protein [Terriglobales bacterium]